MSSVDEYYTIQATATAEIKVKGSRFIGTVSPAQTEAEAENFIRQLQKTYHDATHNCYAYSVLQNNQTKFRHNDAGEPTGTAGPPILNVIQGKNLLNIVIVVTRYFGGTKLGKGGLIRAYSECTKQVIDQADILRKIIRTKITVQFAYALIGNVMHLVSQLDGRTVTTNYYKDVELTIEIPRSRVDMFRTKIIDLTSGNVKFV